MNSDDLLEATLASFHEGMSKDMVARAALSVAIEAAAKVAEDAYKRGHLKQDIDSEIEPDEIAAAIRALKPKD